MKIRRFVLPLFFVAILMATFTVSAHIRWKSMVYDFGTFHEEDGIVSGRLTFINEGPDTTFISRVRPGCGCTSADFVPGNIAPGDSATVGFSYDPKGRPGPFRKNVKVYTGKENTVSTIYLQGTVIGGSSTMSKSYPYEAGPLRFAVNELTTDEVRHGSSRYLYVMAYNVSDETVWPTVQNLPETVSVMASSPSVLPGETVSFSIYYDSKLEAEMGEKDYAVEFIPSAGSQPFIVTLHTSVVPDTSKMSADDVLKAPSLSLDKDIIELALFPTKPVTLKVGIHNAGKSEMTVNRIYTNSDAIKIKSIPVKIKPGKSGSATVVLDPSMLPEGPQRIELKISTNDPIHPIGIVSITGIK